MKASDHNGWQQQAMQYVQPITASASVYASKVRSFYTRNRKNIKHLTHTTALSFFYLYGGALITNAVMTYALKAPSVHEKIMADTKISLATLLPLLISQSDTQLLQIFAHNGWRQQAKICARLPISFCKACTSHLPSIEQAVRDNNQAAIEYYVYTNTRDTEGNSILHAAVEQKNDALVQFLIEHGADIHAQNNRGDTALHIAIEHEYHALMQKLINYGANVNKQNKLDLTPLHYALGTQNPMETFHSTSYDLQAAKRLIQNGADIDAPGPANNTALHSMSLSGFIEPAHLLIECGANIDTQNIDGFTPLHYAAMREHLDTVQILLQCSAQPSKNDNIHHQIPVSADAAVQDLLIQTRDDNAWLENHADSDVLSLMIEHKHAQTLHLYNHTHDTSLLGDFSVYSSLYHQNKIYDIIAQGDAPQEWALYATRCGHQSELELLLAQDYIQDSINKIQDANGNRPLHIAAHYNRPTIVTMLLRIADPDLQNNAHQTAHDIISTYNYSLTKKIFYRYKHVDKILQRGTRVDTTDTRKHITDLPPELLQNITHR
jgi:ankyrin repeat protein